MLSTDTWFSHAHDLWLLLPNQTPVIYLAQPGSVPDTEDVKMEQLNLDVGDKKRGIGHMIVGVHGVWWVPKAAVKTTETSGRCPWT
jgi:hypothetical protein